MERPVYLRTDSYNAIISSLSDMNDASLLSALRECGYHVLSGLDRERLTDIVIQTPSRYLYYYCELLKRPDLLSNMFIEFDDDELDAGHTYLIDAEAADEIVAKENMILLRSGCEGAMISRKRIEHALSNGCTIDYRESH